MVQTNMIGFGLSFSLIYCLYMCMCVCISTQRLEPYGSMDGETSSSSDEGEYETKTESPVMEVKVKENDVLGKLGVRAKVRSLPDLMPSTHPAFLSSYCLENLHPPEDSPPSPHQGNHYFYYYNNHHNTCALQLALRSRKSVCVATTEYITKVPCTNRVLATHIVFSRLEKKVSLAHS